MVNTTQIVKVAYTHDYFPGAMEGLEIQPTQATEKWMRTHRILLRKTPTDITLYRTPETPEDYSALLTFWLHITDTAFYNYTLLPAFPASEQLCYLTNKEGTLGSASEIEESNFLNKLYGIVLKEEDMGEKPLQITNQAGETVLEMPWDGRTAMPPAWDIWPAGKYSWTYGNEQGFFLGDPDGTRNMFGLLEIVLTTSESPSYQIRLRARSSIWEYYIIEKNTHGNQYEIVDEKRQYTFKMAEPAEVMGGKPAVKIASEASIPFKKLPDYEFKLVTQPQPGNGIQPWNISMMLPAARSDYVKLSTEATNAYTTPIFIYI